MCTEFGCTDIELESLVSGINSVPVNKLRKTCLYLKLLQALHFLNMPGAMESIFSMVQSLQKQKMKERNHVHSKVRSNIQNETIYTIGTRKLWNSKTTVTQYLKFGDDDGDGPNLCRVKK